MQTTLKLDEDAMGDFDVNICNKRALKISQMSTHHVSTTSLSVLIFTFSCELADDKVCRLSRQEYFFVSFSRQRFCRHPTTN